MGMLNQMIGGRTSSASISIPAIPCPGKAYGESVSSMPAKRTGIPPYEFLHDLENDPDELVNFAKNPEYAAILTELRLRTRSLAEKYANANLETE